MTCDGAGACSGNIKLCKERLHTMYLKNISKFRNDTHFSTLQNMIGTISPENDLAASQRLFRRQLLTSSPE